MIIRMVFEFEVCVSYFQLFCICGRNTLIVLKLNIESSSQQNYGICVSVFLYFCDFVFLKWMT